MVTILMMSAKIATLGLLKIKVFWNNGFGVIISSMTSPTRFYYVTQIILKMWWCDNSSISMREVNLTSILSGFD